MGGKKNRRRSRNRSRKTSKSDSSLLDSSSGAASSSTGYANSISNSGSLHAFSYSELKAATLNFQPDSFLTEDQFGSVFKGWVDENTFSASHSGSGSEIAVKVLNHEGFQGHRELLMERHFLGHIHHESLGKLIGFCMEDDHRLLVYEFVSHGSHEKDPFSCSKHETFSWETKVKILADIAKRLQFLHNQPVVHRDLKPANILLDSHHYVKLSSFGLPKGDPTRDKSHMST